MMTVTAQSQSDICKSRLWGKVVDEHDSSALNFAMIYIAELKLHVLSDESGNYVFENLCDGTYTIDVRHIGCEPIEVSVKVNGNTRINFYPEHHTEELKALEIVTVEEKPHFMDVADTITPRQVEESSGKNLGEMLKAVPGVSTLQTGASISKPVIHGMYGNRILIINNGVRQEGQQWGAEHAPEIDPFTASDFTVVKGASAFRYGPGAMGGVVVMEPKALRSSGGIGGEVNLAGFSNGRMGVTSAMLEGTFGKKLRAFSWRTQGSAKKGGNVNSPDYFLKNTGLEELNFSYALQWKIEKMKAQIYYSQFNTKIGIFSGSHIGNLTDLEEAIESDVPLETSGFSYDIGRPYQLVEHEVFKAEYSVGTGEKGDLNLVYTRQYDLREEYDKHVPRNDSLAASGAADMQLEIVTNTGDVSWQQKAGHLFRATIGASGTLQENTTMGRYLIPNFRNTGGGLYFIESLKVGKFKLEAGLRADVLLQQTFSTQRVGSNYEQVNTSKSYSGLGASAGLSYSPKQSWSLTYNTGTTWRPPSINELYSNGLHHGTASVEYGDSNLTSEQSFSNSISFDYHPARSVRADLTVYYNLISGYINLSPQLPPTLTIRGAFPTFVYSQADASFSGADLFLSWNMHKHFESSVKSSLVRARNLDDGGWFDLIPPDQAEIRFTFKAGDKLKFSKTYLSLIGLAVAKQTRLSGHGDYAQAPDAYFLLGFESGTTFRLRNQKFILGFGITNVLNTSFRDYMDRFRYYTDAMGRNISLRIKIPLAQKQVPDNNQSIN